MALRYAFQTFCAHDGKLMLSEFQETSREIHEKVFFSGYKSFSSDFPESLELALLYDVRTQIPVL